jgi:hypothetical protein
MTPGQSIHAVAIATNTPEEVVFQHDRNLVKAGLRTMGGRGRSAPKVTPLDTARLLVATLGSIRTKDSVATVRDFEGAIFVPPRILGGRIAEARADGRHHVDDPILRYDAEALSGLAIMDLPEEHNFIEGVAALIASASGPLQQEHPALWVRKFENIEILCRAPDVAGRIGYFESPSAALYTTSPLARSVAEDVEADDPRKIHGIQQTRLVLGSTLLLLGRAFREGGLPIDVAAALQDLSRASVGKPNKRKAKLWAPVRDKRA